MRSDFASRDLCIPGYLSRIIWLDQEDWEKYFTKVKPEDSLLGTPFSGWNDGLGPIIGNCYTFICGIAPPDMSLFWSDQWGRESYRIFIFHIPRIGLIGGNPTVRFKSQNVHEGLCADGFIYAGRRMLSADRIPDGSYLIAGYCYNDWPRKNDSHFYIYDPKSALWFQKMGAFGPVVSTDAKEKPLVNLKKAARSGFDEFVGYYLSPPNRPRGEIIIVDQFGKPFSCPMPRQSVPGQQRQHRFCA